MKEYVYLSEQGDDKYSGLSETTAVRTADRAIKIAKPAATSRFWGKPNVSRRNWSARVPLASLLPKRN